MRETDPNLILKKDHSGSTTIVAPHRGTPLRCFTTGQSVLFNILYIGVHKWCTHLRKRVFGQFNLRKRLPSVWHIVICSSTSCHLWKYQRKWVMALLRHPMLTFLRGFDNFFFPDIFSVTCTAVPESLCVTPSKKSQTWEGWSIIYLSCAIVLSTLSLMLQFQHDFNIRYLIKKKEVSTKWNKEEDLVFTTPFQHNYLGQVI